MNADRRIADLTTLIQIAATLNESPDLTSALRASLERLVRLMGLTTGWMFMLDPNAPNSDAILTLHTPGSALGILDSIRLMEAEVRFEPGDVLLMDTDGISDALNASAEEFGVERRRAPCLGTGIVWRPRSSMRWSTRSGLSSAAPSHSTI